MRNAILFLILMVLAACDDIAPVDTVDLCKGDKPPSDTCEQCKQPPFAADCPHCLANPDDPDCAEATDGGGGAGKGDSGKGGAGSSGKGGTGSNGMIGGDGGRSGSSGGGGSGGSGSGGKGGSGTGGKEASGGSGGGMAEPCSKCPKEKPNCFDDECVECAKAADCKGDAKLCDDDTHTCIECQDNDDCADNDDNKYCDTAAHACVECLGDGHCPSASAPQCTSHKCGDCTDNDACNDHEDKAFCDEGSNSPTKGECVECLKDVDCDNPKPQCSSSHECAPCTSNGTCARLTATPICNTRPNVETSGQCVQCTGATENAKCGDKACDQHTGECTDNDRHTLAPCEVCVADSECVGGARCVMQSLNDVEVGRHCFLLNTDGKNCSVDQFAFRPYGQKKSLTSIDGAPAADYCLPGTTCPAVLSANTSCGPAVQCGEQNVDDGICLGSGTCSFACTEDYDCPGTVITDCTSNICQ